MGATAVFSRRWPLRDERCREVATHGETGLSDPPDDTEVHLRVISELTKNPARRATMAATEGRMAEEEFDDQEEGRRTQGVFRRPSDAPAGARGIREDE